jgi:hypothetical protein
VPAFSTIWAPSGAAVCGASDPSTVVLSQPLIGNLIVYRGDTGRFRVSATDGQGGDPVDLTDATWEADIRLTVDAAEPLGSFEVDLVDAFTAEVTLPAGLSATLPPTSVWDLQMTLNGDTRTLIRGDLTVTKDVTR